ncbi:predicted protein [Chaetomium globosum CBS 148.51]|uniref:Uncharacterized protein n=1 Tax=Chaetomium globosum (strain ATCC 6205 / CBS 148.51 / DSM 1962 / NBRC 6347 / NRRL 1970) TaxID=306901 RepID=Q2HEH8_CHAGB|nr:uncharacterized protein CHGG_01376 [Chaetomium globosum CBS 148.51]EAQ93141.1 predicted protein [Chaetomium globosum CBS 148.51]
MLNDEAQIASPSLVGVALTEWGSIPPTKYRTIQRTLLMITITNATPFPGQESRAAVAGATRMPNSKPPPPELALGPSAPQGHRIPISGLSKGRYV